MYKSIEFDIEKEEFKKYIEECLNEENIDYKIKIEDRWIQRYKDASKYYQVYCIYVNSSDLVKVKKYMEDYENGIIITEDIEEFKDVKDEENNDRFRIFSAKKFLKFYWLAIVIIGILIIIGIKLTS